MGASVCFNQPLTITRQQPLRLRYLLHAHTGPADPQKANAAARQFADSPPFEVQKSGVRHQQFVIRRAVGE
jgi:hypothetical protein